MKNIEEEHKFNLGDKVLIISKDIEGIITKIYADSYAVSVCDDTSNENIIVEECDLELVTPADLTNLKIELKFDMSKYTDFWEPGYCSGCPFSILKNYEFKGCLFGFKAVMEESGTSPENNVFGYPMSFTKIVGTCPLKRGYTKKTENGSCVMEVK